MDTKTGRRTFIAIAAGATILKLLFVWKGWAEGSLVADDAYYYFVIARNIAHGLGSTFDGLSATNGYHPLWMMLLVPIFALKSGSIWIPVRLALTLCAVLDLITGILVFRFFSRLNLRREALIASTLWLLAPYTMLLGLRGLEASVSTLVILVTFLTLAKLAGTEGRWSYGTAVMVGVLVGLCGLARTDNLITIGAMVGVFLFLALQRRQVTISEATKWLYVAVVAGLVIMSPWFLWNAHNFGSILQVSGQTKFYSASVYGGITTDWKSLNGVIKSVAYPVLAPLIYPLRYLSGEEFLSPTVSYGVVGGFLFMMVIPLIFSRKQIAETMRSSGARFFIVLVLTYVVVHTLLFGFVWRNYATWYALPTLLFLMMILAVALPCFLSQVLKSRIRKWVFVSFVVALNLAIYALFITRLPHDPQRPATGWSKSFTEIKRLYDAPVKVGAFNAGSAGYVAHEYEGITVVNLDCLVNNEAFREVRAGRYLDYLTKTVDVFIEDPRFAAMFLDETQLDSLVELYPQLPGFHLWQRRDADKPMEAN